MRIPIYQIDAFTDRLFSGNPAAVCPLEQWLPDAVMQAIAAENNLSETAFFVPAGDGFELRWFTPEREVDLCGHATLATAHLLLRHLEPGRVRVGFATRSGRLEVSARRRSPGDGLSRRARRCRLTRRPGWSRPSATSRGGAAGNYLMVVYRDERAVRGAPPGHRRDGAGRPRRGHRHRPRRRLRLRVALLRARARASPKTR